MMNKSKPFRHLAIAVFACLLAASCSDVTDDGTTLPDGTYPMTFTAQVDGLTVSRATTDNSWTGTEKVAIQIAGEVKKYAAASGGNLTVAGGGTPFYWQTTNNITVNAWYPYSETKPTAEALRVKSNQSEENNYQSSDYLEAVDATVTFNNPAALAFRHRTAKVVVTLTAGEGVTDVANAAVTFVNQTGVDGGRTEVIPKTETPSGGSGNTYTALLIPQQMLNKKFIKVTAGAGGAARDYYYTPAGSTDANLEAGKQYAYTITVKKTGLEVTVTGNGTSWTDRPTDTTPAPSVTFCITAPTSGVKIGVASGSGGTLVDNSNGSYTLSGGSAVSITATSTYIQSIKGLYEVAGDGTTYTLKSDLLITGYTLADARVGDFYCKRPDGSTGYLIPGDASLTEAQQAACIGIVMKVGRGTDEGKTGNDDKNAKNWTDNDTYMLKGTTTEMSTIHGYVLALKDGNGRQTCVWSSFNTEIGTSKKKYTLFCGYSDTQTTKDYVTTSIDKSLETDFPAAYHASEGYETIENGKYSSPSNSSGWFLPSAGQCWYWYKYKNVLKSSMDKVSGDGWCNYYWSSSECSNDPEYSDNPKDRARFLDFKNNRVHDDGKTNDDRNWVRSCLAF